VIDTCATAQVLFVFHAATQPCQSALAMNAKHWCSGSVLGYLDQAEWKEVRSLLKFIDFY
jgi:hypothetical protein